MAYMFFETCLVQGKKDYGRRKGFNIIFEQGEVLYGEFMIGYDS